jgi:hypothetical protein
MQTGFEKKKRKKHKKETRAKRARLRKELWFAGHCTAGDFIR